MVKCIADLDAGAGVVGDDVAFAGADPADQARFAPGLQHLALRVRNFDEAYAALGKAGVQFLSEPGDATGGGRIVSFRDPEGNELQIVERPK